jgi:hypothetical protein
VSRVTSFRPLFGLVPYLLGLLLLAPPPVSARAPGHEVAVAPVGESSVRAFGDDKRGSPSDNAAAAAYAGIDDDSKPLALFSTAAEFSSTQLGRCRFGRTGADAIPLSHRPCAGLPTGPPRS